MDGFQAGCHLSAFVVAMQPQHADSNEERYLAIEEASRNRDQFGVTLARLGGIVSEGSDSLCTL